MIGDHHVYNCLVAAAVGLGYGIDLPTVIRGIESVGHIPGRLDRIECGQPFSVFVDYAHTPDALTSVLTALRGVTAGRIICVFGAGGDRDAAKRPVMGRTVEQHADLAIITTDNPRHEDPKKIALGIRAGFKYPSRVQMVADRARAIETALAAAGPDDCVLIAGKGHEQTQAIGDSQIPLDDADVARHWLYNVQREPVSPPQRRRSYFLSNS
jgi:UDP-N-acetylmuramoyl-L-alanyl-D-glutamate--2,6-diaminopimelate ligase